jgi:cell volume regulation protein A
VTRGEEVNFAWGLFDAGNNFYDVGVIADLSVPGGQVEVDPPVATLAPGQFLEVYVNVTNPEGFEGTIEGNVTISVTDQGTLESWSEVIPLTAVVSPPEEEILPTVIVVFVASATVIFIGFFAAVAFERTKIPDLLILIAVGLFLGPFLGGYVGITLVPAGVLQLVTPYFAALALAIILFDGGLNLNFELVLRRINIAFVHTMVAFVLTVVAVAAVAHLVLGYPLIIGVLLGAILGGISGAVVINLVRVMSVSKDTETILTLEAVLTDVLCIIVALALIQLLQSGGAEGPSAAFGNLAAAFSVAVVIALVFGIFWLKVLKRLYGKPFSFMITIAALFFLYGAVEFVGGSGPMAGLIFGLVLGNKEEFARMFKMKTKFVLDEKIKQFHSELSFVVRTFFFVFLGLMFTLDVNGPVQVSSSIPFLSDYSGTVTLLLIGVVLVFLVIIATRYVASAITVRLHPESGRDKTALWVTMGRGLAPAVLASVPFAIPAFTNPQAPGYAAYHAMMAPYQNQFLSIASLMIILTVIATTVGVTIVEKRHLGQSPLERAKARHEKRLAAAQKREWRRSQAEEKRQRIRLKKHQKAIEAKKRRKGKR